jgi:lysophospholipase L1-like esterase
MEDTRFMQNHRVFQLKSPLLYTLCAVLLCCASIAHGQTGGAACLRVVRNQLGGNSGNWGQAGAPVVFGNGGTVSSFTGVGPATFTLEGSTAGYSFLGVQLNLTKNARYSLRVTVSNYTGNYYGTNFEILGASANSFSGVTRLNFTGNGVYSLVFTYLGTNAPYQARVGIDVDAGPSTASGPGGFTVSDLSLELLPNGTAAPSEYVTPGYAWGFNYPSLDSYNSTTGRLTEADGAACAPTYRNVWAVTADSFGDNTYSFPNQLANNLAQGFVFFVDSVAGRRLAVAQQNIAALMSNTAVVQTDTLLPSTALPSTAATPNGIIVEGGINDILQGSSAAQVEAVVDLILSSLARPRQSVILITLSPFGNNANWTAAREQVRLAYNQWLRTRDSPQNGIYVYDMAALESAGGLANDANPALLAADVDSGDGLHPNLAGGVRIASHLNQILDEINATPATDGPMPLWALAALAAGCMGIASRRLAQKKRPTRKNT